MTYTEFRKQFANAENFKAAFSKLTEKEAQELIDEDNAPIFIKAAMMDTWRMAKEEAKER